jgi:serine-type D-Ala-D-Ala carboxypeptidase/endopeptidase (penicillin-binding protein 4)
MKRIFGVLVIGLASVCAGAQRSKHAPAGGGVTAKAGRAVASSDLAGQIEGLLAGPEVARAHWGVLVTTLDGTPIYSMNEGQYFQPASNAKLFTTSAALALLGPSTMFETRIFAKGVLSGSALAGDVVLVGGGDANLSGRTLPYVAPALRPKPVPGALPVPEVDPLRYLAELADQVAATGLKVVNGDVVGDDTLFPWEPYPQDWSIDDTVWGYGAPVSALTIDDNQLSVKAMPGATVGSAGVVTIDPLLPAYYTVDATGLVTGAAKSGSHVQMERALGSKVLRVYGSIALDAHADEEEVAIHDPAEYAAVALKGMLEARGIAVTGVARAVHRLPMQSRGFLDQTRESIRFVVLGGEQARDSMGPKGCGPCDGLPKSAPELLAVHRSPTLLDDLVVTNKVSQNLHAELLLHHLSVAIGDIPDRGSTAQGARVVRSFVEGTGVDKDDFVFYDGSGLSGHDLVTPRATVRLLQYAQGQPWFADWKASLPVGGEDGSLASRFPKAPLKDHVFAKTGTLGEARALSGYLDCASGRTVIFSIMVGNHAPGSNADRDVMDKIVAAIAAAN